MSEATPAHVMARTVKKRMQGVKYVQQSMSGYWQRTWEISSSLPLLKKRPQHWPHDRTAALRVRPREAWGSPDGAHARRWLALRQVAVQRASFVSRQGTGFLLSYRHIPVSMRHSANEPLRQRALSMLLRSALAPL